MNNAELCFELRKASRAITRFYDMRLAETGIRSTQLQMLLVLQSLEGKNYSAISKKLVMERTCLSRNLAVLEKLGLVSITWLRNHSGPNGGKSCALTQGGRDTIERCRPIIDKANQDVSACFNDGLRGQLVGSLEIFTLAISSNNSVMFKKRETCD